MLILFPCFLSSSLVEIKKRPPHFINEIQLAQKDLLLFLTTGLIPYICVPGKLELYESRYANETNRLSLLHYHFSSPSPPIRRVISSIRSKGNGGDETGFMASDISFMGLSSAAIRLELNAPHILQR